ncbi:RND family efflux transporter, MFP subunit [Chitinophaga ginsengisegetis]|uniref:RND family efflux transporter, MFP subunit n=1 Tax=Chitinophaga ginsengisegetis TaxID=393003 RepID=A0A1T5P4N1_9BACT|nr:efflux RND transporter periplasmic adaptor subunit [Chitinophaga ginsengisegetis]MDR6570342.1 RND family efflux transporter MFP subunit [Chitinophaga ginsengisegetis]MDR6650076.1 RND family efflux transporter MFP subunit [Chitinophaga ginsengisegetis]MDR6656283.1 RND family efflux transporter MFP subunit [Chitinophaga ginsengisegetis]SKD07744.1 RND family efflux transporter, MFP subunit [Chitinophaga ginsengisegetis]
MIKKYSFLIPFITLVLAACGGGGNKAEQLEKLKQEKVKYNENIDKKIAALEKEVGVKDTTAQKMKDVTVTAITDTIFEHYIDVQGSVDARENVNVSARVPGVITNIFVREGQAVKQGQTLAQVDDQVLRANMAELRTQMDLANTLFEKQKNLWSQKIGSEVQYLNAKNQKESLERKMATLQDQQSQTRIIAPISGTVDAVIAKVGDNAAPGAPAFRVVNANNLKVTANVAEAYAGLLKSGDAVILSFPDINREIRSTIGFASRTIDPLSRTIKVEVPLKPDAGLRPNMIARIRIVDYTAKNAVVIPVSVIQYTSGKPYVMVAQNANGKMVAQRKTIDMGRTYNDKAEIKSGLTTGDKIITTGFQGLNDNDLIKL